jgi:hypothetical protein
VVLARSVLFAFFIALIPAQRERMASAEKDIIDQARNLHVGESDTGENFSLHQQGIA